MTGEHIKIELSNEDANLFRQFREHQDVFGHMLKSGVFDTRNGVVSMSFNQDGVLTQINKEVLTYKRVALGVVLASK